MVTRIVKMTFRNEACADFLLIFDEYKERIRNAGGCLHLDLLRDKEEIYVFFTYSKWDNEASLDAYRYSETFKAVWPKVKVLFAAPAEAWTVEEIVNM